MGPVLTSDRGAVRIVTLNRPEMRNALNMELRTALREALRQATESDRVRAIIITGAGSAFCAGLDLAELASIRDRDSAQHRADSRALADLFLDVYTCPKPVVAAVNGPAIAGGAGLATVCDVMVMSEASSIGYSEARIGFVPALVGVFLARQIGERKARELLLTARRFRADDALAIGLANAVVPASTLLPTSLDFATTMAANAPSSLAMIKALLAATAGSGLEDGLETAIDVSVLARTTEDLQEGIRAFFEGRDPRW